jgi:sec-independent protein translocase protein TatA
MFGLGVPEVVIILALGVLLFGSAKLPQLGSGLGKAIRDFRQAVSDRDKEPDSEALKKDDSKVLPS